MQRKFKHQLFKWTNSTISGGLCDVIKSSTTVPSISVFEFKSFGAGLNVETTLSKTNSITSRQKSTVCDNKLVFFCNPAASTTSDFKVELGSVRFINAQLEYRWIKRYSAMNWASVTAGTTSQPFANSQWQPESRPRHCQLPLTAVILHCSSPRANPHAKSTPPEKIQNLEWCFLSPLTALPDRITPWM